MKKHYNTIEKFEGTSQLLAEAIGDLRYDGTAELFGFLAEKFAKDAQTDLERGRVRLARLLCTVASACRLIKSLLEMLWRICEPRMPKEEDGKNEK